MAVIIDGGSGALDEITQTWVDAGKTAVPNGSNLVDANDLGTAAYVSTIDEDDMASDSDTAVPTQQSVKAYVDANAGGGDVGDLTTTGLTAANMLRVAVAGGLEERTPAQVLSDIGAAASGHTHDDSEITAAASATNYTPAAATVEGHLSGIDTALGSVGGAGDVTGPASSTDNAIVRFDGTGGKTLQNTAKVTIDDNGYMTISPTAAAAAYFTVSDSDAELFSVRRQASYRRLYLYGTEVLTASSTSTLRIGDGFTSIVLGQPLTIEYNPADTSSVLTTASFLRATTGTAANGLGQSIDLKVEIASGGITTRAAQIQAIMADVSASWRGNMVLLAGDNGGMREGIRIGANGSAATIGFYGATPQAKSTGWAVTNVTPDKVFDADSTSIDELADVLGTLITYLIARGDLGA